LVGWKHQPALLQKRAEPQNSHWFCVLKWPTKFWPSRDLHAILNVTVRGRLASDGRLAGVIPAFQMNRRCREYADCRERNIPSMPSNKDELMRQMTSQSGSVSAFDPTNRGGHGSTRYDAWVDQEDGTFVDLGCVKSVVSMPRCALFLRIIVLLVRSTRATSSSSHPFASVVNLPPTKTSPSCTPFTRHGRKSG